MANNDGNPPPAKRQKMEPEVIDISSDDENAEIADGQQQHVQQRTCYCVHRFLNRVREELRISIRNEMRDLRMQINRYGNHVLEFIEMLERTINEETDQEETDSDSSVEIIATKPPVASRKKPR